MKIGYARSSIIEDDGLDAQISALKMAGCKKITKEQVSSVAERPELERTLAALKPGDCLVVANLDRVARNTIDLGHIIERIESAGANLHVISLKLDMPTAIAFIAFERSMRRERQREGVARAQARGAYTGRPPADPELVTQIKAMAKAGQFPTAIARTVGCGVSTVKRLLKAN
jgi:DNA invertase Pin-like site-specific DNA recombinase